MTVEEIRTHVLRIAYTDFYRSVDLRIWNMAYTASQLRMTGRPWEQVIEWIPQVLVDKDGVHRAIRGAINQGEPWDALL